MAALAITRDEHDAAALRRAASRSRDADVSRWMLALASRVARAGHEVAEAEPP